MWQMRFTILDDFHLFKLALASLQSIIKQIKLLAKSNHEISFNSNCRFADYAFKERRAKR